MAIISLLTADLKLYLSTLLFSEIHTEYILCLHAMAMSIINCPCKTI